MIDRDRQNRIALVALAGLSVAAVIFLFSRPPIPQPPGYHNFADHRSWLGIPNACDVFSNLPFLFVGLWGALFTVNPRSDRAFTSRPQRLAYEVFFVGVGLTFFGSCYYHLHPTNARLVWDRLPMTIGFMGLLSAMFAERVSARLSKALLLPLILAGGGSVGYWYLTEALGRGDLRPYILVQFGSLLVIVAMLVLFPTRGLDTGYIVVALAFYAGAKLFESFDAGIFNSIHIVSGHTLKHLAAGIGTYFILRMLQRRTLREDVRRSDAVPLTVEAGYR
jgi:hypothetical protein